MVRAYQCVSAAVRDGAATRTPPGRAERENEGRVRERFRDGDPDAVRALYRSTYIAELLAVPARGKALVGGPGVQFAIAGNGGLRVLSSTCSVADALSHRC